jgi:hypothetical protein
LIGIPVVVVLSFISSRKHRECPLAHGAVILAVVEAGVLLSLLLSMLTPPLLSTP